MIWQRTRVAKWGFRMRDTRWPHGAYAAEFEDEGTFSHAVKRLRQEGYTKIAAYSPYPVPDVEDSGAGPRALLPRIVFFAGVAGGLVGYWIQWFANAVSYPLNIGGRPAHATPAFFIPTFEATVLCASLAAFLGLFAILRLPRPWHPIFEVDGFERASIDRFWIAVDADDRRSDEASTPKSLDELHALRVVRVPGDEA